MSVVTFVDEAGAGTRSAPWEVDFLEETVSVAELIRRGVHQQVAEHDARLATGAGGARLIDLTATERALNGPREGAYPGSRTVRAPLDRDAQCARALDAFRRNGFVVLVDGTQVTALETQVGISSATEVTFLRLLPLAGG